MRTPQDILVYVDGSEQSVTATKYAICLASVFQSGLKAMHVINIRAMEDLVRAHIFIQDEQAAYERDMEADAERYLRYANELALKKGIDLEPISRRGSVHREIVKVVNQMGIDLLVIGELSRIRSRRDEFYDETERAMRSVPCSVLIVKDEDAVWEMYESLV